MYNGILNIYKEKGFTSHDVVAKLRGILNQKKIGHTGTLDPYAMGVLPVCLGRATKLCDMLTHKEKTYSTELILGKATDTQDIWGKTINETDIARKRETVTDELIYDAVMSFIGEYSQIPPMYSAIKVNGKKLYELAREGVEIERKPRNVRIIAIKKLVIDYPRISMEVECSKGTYIRTLCHDIGLKLGTYGCMTFLERIKTGVFEKEASYTLAQVEDYMKRGLLDDIIFPIDKMFEKFKSIYMEETLNKLLYNGNPIPVKMIKNIQINNYEADGMAESASDEKNMAESYKVYDYKNEFIGIYKIKDSLLMPEKLFL